MGHRVRPMADVWLTPDSTLECRATGYRPAVCLLGTGIAHRGLFSNICSNPPFPALTVANHMLALLLANT